MPLYDSLTARRRFLQSLGAGAGMALFTTPGLYAETLKVTASTTEGPFYPDKMPLDTDNDLPENAQDGIIKRLDQKELDTLLVDFKPVAGSKIGELSANFDLVLGKTLAELEDGTLGGGVAISEVQHPKR